MSRGRPPEIGRPSFPLASAFGRCTCGQIGQGLFNISPLVLVLPVLVRPEQGCGVFNHHEPMRNVAIPLLGFCRAVATVLVRYPFVWG